jgi:hypothetical protein
MEKPRLQEKARFMMLKNLNFLEPVSKREVFKYIVSSDIGASVLKKSEIFKTVKLQSSDKLQSGGCIIETEFGAIDASVPERIERAMIAVKARAPKTEN